MFGDGGILAFGANAFNMAFVIPFLGYVVYRIIADRSGSARGRIAGIVAGSYLSFNAAALSAAIELGIQPLLARGPSGLPAYFPYPLSVSIPAVMVPHLAVAGVVDALFSAAVFAFLRRVSPGALYEGSGTRVRGACGVLVLLVCLSPLGLLASGEAWGEWSVATLRKLVGYVPSGMRRGFSFSSLFPDYVVKGFPEILGTVASAAAGAAILVIAFKLLGLLWREHRRRARA